MLTWSEMPALATRAPDFDLPDVAGRRITLRDFDGVPALLVCFLCAHCDSTRRIAPALGALADAYGPRRLGVVGINSNDDSYPEDAPELMAATADRSGWSFPYLHDATQDVARAYRAACTPDFFLYDGRRTLAYRGRFDGGRPGDGQPVTGSDLRRAVDDVLAGRPVTGPQRPSIGCNIKWRIGGEPDYFHPSFLERVDRLLRSLRRRARGRGDRG